MRLPVRQKGTRPPHDIVAWLVTCSAQEKRRARPRVRIVLVISGKEAIIVQ